MLGVKEKNMDYNNNNYNRIFKETEKNQPGSAPPLNGFCPRVTSFLVSPRVTASRFFAGNREAELKPTTFPSLLLFRVFPSFLFS